MIAPLSLPKFLAAWVPALALSASIEVSNKPRLSDMLVTTVGGVELPIATCLLAAIGVMAARPLARRNETGLSWPLFALVSGIMLLAAELWVIEDRPGLLFSFVVALGLGFAGFSLIETLGSEIKAIVPAIFQKFGLPTASPTPPSPETEEDPAP